jgi:hypothetical protein
MFEEIDTAESGEDTPLAPPPSKNRTKAGELIQSQMNLSGSGDANAGPEAEQFEDKDLALELESHRYAAPQKPPAPEQESMQDSTPQEEIFDLYELGAVDYQPDGVQHNA